MKYIIIFLLTVVSLSTQAQTTTPHIEFNTGFSTGIIPAFPGGSLLYGATTKWNSGIIFDYQGGLAFPSLLTGKMGIGYDIDGTEATVGFRVWPPTSYAQVTINRPDRRSDIVLSVERMLWSDYLFVQQAIFTIGWRFDNKKYKDIRHK